MSIARFISSFAVGGGLVPLIFQAIWMVVSKYPAIDLKLGLVIQKLMLVLWPSSLIMIPASGDESLYFVALLISITVNVVLYAGIGAAIWCGLMRHRIVLILLITVLVAVWWRLSTL